MKTSAAGLISLVVLTVFDGVSQRGERVLRFLRQHECDVPRGKAMKHTESRTSRMRSGRMNEISVQFGVEAAVRRDAASISSRRSQEGNSLGCA
jgi:hypothetical protein